MTQIDGERVSDTGLRVFIAAAEAGSFSAAARMLGIGQPAVSHAVARLEVVLGLRLFERSTAGIELTRRGADLAQAVADGFRGIDDAIAAARGNDNEREVTLSVSTSLASYWLMPRLADFKRLHPEIELRVLTTDSDRSVGVDDADLWIPLGVVERTDLDAVRFCDEELVPVATGELAHRLGVTGAASLRNAPLLHLEERYETRFDWRRWFDTQGVTVVGELHGDRSNDYSLILQAALEGQGVALGWWHIVSPLVDQGRLVAVGSRMTTDQPFPILSRRGMPLRPAAVALRDWLQLQFA